MKEELLALLQSQVPAGIEVFGVELIQTIIDGKDAVILRGQCKGNGHHKYFSMIVDYDIKPEQYPMLVEDVITQLFIALKMEKTHDQNAGS